MANTLQYAISLLFRFLEYAIFIEVIISWLPINRDNEFIRILHIFTDPFMVPGRRLQEKLFPGLMIDFSPIIAFFILMLLQNVVYGIIGLF